MQIASWLAGILGWLGAEDKSRRRSLPFHQTHLVVITQCQDRILLILHPPPKKRWFQMQHTKSFNLPVFNNRADGG